MPIHPLPILSEEQELKAINALTPPETIVVRYGRMKLIGEFKYRGDEIPGCGTRLVIRTPRGTELASMLTTTCSNSGCGSSISRQQMLEYIDASGGPNFPFYNEGKILRVATPEDLREQAHLDADAQNTVKTAKQYIRELDLPMKLVDVESLLGGERIVFYFTSEDRVDFRELVRKLAADLHTRIEMRQVGARDEARLVADYEKCGQRCCCKQFLKVLKPVSMRNAKIQKATLDPSKISGRCGRLMCCLRYEEKTYDQLRKNLPHRNTRVITEEGIGSVVSTQILTQLVLVELDDTHQRLAFPVENIEVADKQREEEYLAEKQAKREEEKAQYEARRAEEKASRRREQRARQKQRKAQATDTQPQAKPQADADSPQTDSPDQPKRKRRRRRRRKSADADATTQPNTDTPPKNDAQPQDTNQPPRPKPGQPLADEHVESREGENSANIPTNPNDNNDPDSPSPTRKRRRRRRNRRKRDDGNTPNAQNSPDSD